MGLIIEGADYCFEAPVQTMHKFTLIALLYHGAKEGLFWALFLCYLAGYPEKMITDFNETFLESNCPRNKSFIFSHASGMAILVSQSVTTLVNTEISKQLLACHAFFFSFCMSDGWENIQKDANRFQ